MDRDINGSVFGFAAGAFAVHSAKPSPRLNASSGCLIHPQEPNLTVW